MTATVPDVFSQALRFTLQWEGGYVDDPDDSGGATNHGITQATYNQYRHRQGLNNRDVSTICQSEVQEIYRKDYWTLAHCPSFCPTLAIAMFDTAVNFGVFGAIQFIQEVLGTDQDGYWGPLTALAAQKHDNCATAIALCNSRIAYRHHRVEVNPSQGKFLEGWLNRDRDLIKFIKNLPG